MRRFAGRLLTILTGAVLAAAAPAAGARAQSVAPTLQLLRGGDTVRVWASAPPLRRAVGLVGRVDDDTLALRDLPGRRAFLEGVVIPAPALTYLEVQRGYRRSVGWTVTGALIGLAAGAVVGAFVGVGLECGGSCSEQGDLAGLAGFVIGGGLGAIAGAITGGFIGGQRRPRWVPVGLPAR